MARFKLHAPYAPAGDQPKAIREVVEAFRKGERFVTLLGVTGSGKTFTVANVIAQLGKPTLVLSHNKTLAAQLFAELKEYFPENAVEYFISYYDYYQPEAYVPETDTYIEKEADINEDIERLRLRTTASLLEREDVVVVASVSAIYALGDPEETRKFFFLLEEGMTLDRDTFLRRLVDMQYTRNDVAPTRGTFRVRGDVVEVVPAYEEYVVRVEFWGDVVERITLRDAVTRKLLEHRPRYALYPAGHWLTSEEKFQRALRSIEEELEARLQELRAAGKLLEAQRLEQRTRMDLELLRTTGTCRGIENYSRHFSGRAPGERPFCLLDYFPEDFLLVIDESHVTVPQLAGMYRGDRARKLTLVEYGFRLPSALDNRPLKFEELEAEFFRQVLFVSATPGPYELEKSRVVVEQIIRPTGLVDPEIEVRPTEHQMDDILREVQERVARQERVLITTLTKRMAEDLALHLTRYGVRARYLHSELDAIERVKLLRDLRLGEFDVLVGVNLLREGLDLPEVSLVMILDADKTGFLRSERSLIQMAGRAARNAAGKVILYADEITEAMQRAIQETERRRRIQMAYNREHGITPRTIRKSVDEILKLTRVADEKVFTREDTGVEEEIRALERALSGYELVEELERRMKEAADLWDFERAAQFRDALFRVKQRLQQEG